MVCNALAIRIKATEALWLILVCTVLAILVFTPADPASIYMDSNFHIDQSDIFPVKSNSLKSIAIGLPLAIIIHVVFWYSSIDQGPDEFGA